MVLTALLLGFMGSLHCLGMCGPIAFMLPVDRQSKYRSVLQIFIYHFGRLLAYSIIGLIFGLLGKGLYIFGAQQKLTIIIGIIMIVAVLLPYKYMSKLKLGKPIYSLLFKLKNKLGEALKKKTPDTFLTIGFLNGFLPCGLVYIALLGALAMGNAAQGSLFMFLFGIGTIPLMTAAVYFGKLLKASSKEKLRQFIPIVVVLIGVLFILRGMGLGIPYVSPKPVTEVVSSEIDCHEP